MKFDWTNAGFLDAAQAASDMITDAINNDQIHLLHMLCDNDVSVILFRFSFWHVWWRIWSLFCAFLQCVLRHFVWHGELAQKKEVPQPRFRFCTVAVSRVASHRSSAIGSWQCAISFNRTQKQRGTWSSHSKRESDDGWKKFLSASLPNSVNRVYLLQNC